MTDTYDPSKQPGFIFWGNAKPGEPLSYQALQTRRKIAEELMGKRSPFPKTLGEGLTYAGERFADAMNMHDLDAAEQRNMAYEAQRAAGLPAADTPYAPRGGVSTASQPQGTSAAPIEPPIVPPSVVTTPPPPPTPPRPAPTVTAANVTPQSYDPAAGAGDVSGGANTFSDPGGGRPGGPAYAGPAGNAPGRFGPVMRSPGGNTLALPEQPPPGRFTTAFSPTPTPRELVTQAVAERGDSALPSAAKLTAGEDYFASPGLDPATDAAAVAAKLRERGAQGSQLDPYVNPINPAPIGVEKAPPPASEPNARQAQAQATLPSQEPVPSESPPYETPIPPEPLRPRPLGISKPQADAQALLEDRSINPNGPAATRAKNIIAYQEKLRTELEQQQQADYMRKVQQRDALIAKDEQRKYEADAKKLDEHVKRVGVEKALADLEESYYKRGLPRAQAAAQAALDIQKTQRTVNEPHRFQSQGTQFEQPYNPATGSYGAAAVTPGAPPPEKKPLTVEQAKAVTFVRDVLPDMDLLETKLDHGSALATSLTSSIGASVPVLGNVLPSQKYLDAKNALGRFMGAVMQHLSGAAVSPSEADRNLPAFIPRYGDSREEVLRKAERRRNYVNAVADTAGDSGIDAIEKGRKLVMQANGELPPVRVSTPDEAKNLGAGQIIILPNGDRRTVPWPKHLLPK